MFLSIFSWFVIQVGKNFFQRSLLYVVESRGMVECDRGTAVMVTNGNLVV